MSASLQNKVAIVTGSARGIGASVAVELARNGANVVINYVSPNSKTRAEEVAKTVEGLGSKALVVQADLAKVQDLENLVNETVAAFGKIDILVNNGGVVDFAPIGDISLESYQKIFDINVRAIVFLSQAVVAHMGKEGRIINVSSVAARLGAPGTTVYAASKAAVEGITRVMGIELRDKGIRVNAVAPGPITTDMFTTLDDETQEQFRSKFPVGEASDIANSVLFLASSASGWITGTTLNTNNGAILN
ncbi:hypothetical protein FRC19_011250 [Serendipita sp. 401]|nr:hypothetical protein FRC16_010133 [Serendipita sp. 398]KAG8808632.1 hypothetical protein FRC18_004923 [Serendipita sp. 400]KAG8825518.1 hypothetical protein FRC19_011250 [Serendipita sp. 401]KAG9056399.1 hypothetical protein FS842_010796 [Serendipita sp. 407]